MISFSYVLWVSPFSRFLFVIKFIMQDGTQPKNNDRQQSIEYIYMNYKDIVIAMQWTFQNNRDSQTHYHNWKIFYLVCGGVHFLDYSKLNATSIKIGEKKDRILFRLKKKNDNTNHNACRGRRNETKKKQQHQLSMRYRYREEKKSELAFIQWSY